MRRVTALQERQRKYAFACRQLKGALCVAPLITNPEARAALVSIIEAALIAQRAAYEAYRDQA